MIKNKVAVAAILSALAVSLGLCACAGNSNSRNASSAASSGASGSSSAASAGASLSVASSAASSGSVSMADYWAGKLEDGSTVDYFDNAKDMKPGLVILSVDGTKGKAWVGSIGVGANGRAYFEAC